MKISKKSYAIVAGCYALWGVLPAYWNLLIGVNPLFVLCCRIVFTPLFTIGLLAVTGRLHVLLDTLRNKATMRFLAPASILITFNWGLYIWAVNNGRILDSSLGYYMNPLVVFLLGTIIFKEKYVKLQLVAVAMALTGVLVSVIAYGSFPYVSICLAVSFSLYGVVKKKARADPVASITVESMLMMPFALVAALVFMTDSIKAVNPTDFLLLLGGGVLTALPLIMYSSSVNAIPLIIVGFFQYISPSLAMIYGLLSGEAMSAPRIVSFVFIGLGLITFSIALIRTSKAAENRSL